MPTKPAATQTRYNIAVTEADIEKAHRNNSYKCVVAQAIARTIPDVTRIEVDTQSIRFSRQGARLMFLTPYAVQGYVVAFDAGDPLQPFSFQLRDPIRAKRRPLTDAGQAANRAKARAYKQAHKAVKAAGKSPDSPETKAQIRAATKAAYAEAARQHTGPKTATQPDGRRVTPRVFKRKARSYGHRLLRINQEPIANALN